MHTVNPAHPVWWGMARPKNTIPTIQEAIRFPAPAVVSYRQAAALAGIPFARWVREACMAYLAAPLPIAGAVLTAGAVMDLDALPEVMPGLAPELLYRHGILEPPPVDLLTIRGRDRAPIALLEMPVDPAPLAQPAVRWSNPKGGAKRGRKAGFPNRTPPHD